MSQFPLVPFTSIQTALGKEVRMRVHFLHPRTSTSFGAEVESNTTGQTCIDNLVSSGFLEPAPSGRPYALSVSRNQRQLLPGMSIADAGAQDGDAIAVVQQEQGATQ